MLSKIVIKIKQRRGIGSTGIRGGYNLQFWIIGHGKLKAKVREARYKGQTDGKLRMNICAEKEIASTKAFEGAFWLLQGAEEMSFK